MKTKQKGFAVLEGLLILVIISILGFTGWYVWNSKKKTDSSYNNSSQSGSSIPKYTTIKTFDGCKNASGSKLLETYPEQCITTGGQKFIGPSQKMLKITEWGVYMTYSDADTFSYHISNVSDKKTYWYAEIISANLRKNFGCDSSGAGAIEKTTPTGEIYPDGTTSKEAINKNPTEVKKVGSYYFIWRRNTAACSSDFSQKASDSENAANKSSFKMFQSIQAISQ